MRLSFIKNHMMTWKINVQLELIKKFDIKYR